MTIREVALIVASTYQQACVAAEQLGLERPNLPRGSVIHAGPMGGREKIGGLLPTRTIIVLPTLGDHAEMEILRALARSRAARAQAYAGGREPEVVWT